MQKTILILKNGYRFSGNILQETNEAIVIDDIKLGRTIVDKASISARSDTESD